MHPQRQIVAFVLIAVLIYGGLLAPLYHSVYMALGDFYPAAHPSESHGGQQACHESNEHVAYTDGAVVKAPHEGHPECPFMELFSISLLSYEVGDYSLGYESYNDVQCLAAVEEYLQSASHNAYFLRGPPVA